MIDAKFQLEIKFSMVTLIMQCQLACFNYLRFFTGSIRSMDVADHHAAGPGSRSRHLLVNTSSWQLVVRSHTAPCKNQTRLLIIVHDLGYGPCEMRISLNIVHNLVHGYIL